MKALWKYLVITFENLKIKYKFIVFVSAIMCVFLLFTIAGLQYAFTTYDQQIYRKSSQVLSMSSDSVENELQRIQDISFEIVTDPFLIQQTVHTKKAANRYEQYGIQTAISNRLSDYISSEKYIHSIYLIDTNGKMYSAGNSLAPAAEEEKAMLIKRAEQAHGSNVWVTADGMNRFLTAARQIRSYENLSMENLGTIVIRVDLAKIVASLPEEWEDTQGNTMISNGDHVFFSEEDIRPFRSFNFSEQTAQGYTIKEINGSRYFVTYVKTSFADWTYWHFIPFDAVFSNITKVKYSIIAAFVILLLIVIMTVVHFTRKITTPIEELVQTMHHIQKGDFAIAETMPPPPRHQDEIGMLHRDFTFMVQRINELIKENYEKQLLLKETEFKALQAQMNPHFLYNTLESVNWLAKVNKQTQISKMVESLAYLLRNSVNLKEDIVTIEQEVDLVSHYVTIQKYRFEDRLDFHLEVEPEVLKCRIPKLTIQPLIENAIHYALEKTIDPCTITIRAHKKRDAVFVIVEDNGPGMDAQFLEKLYKGEVKTRGTGIGLKNIDERTKLFFGEKYGITIHSASGRGTAVTVFLPFETGDENHVQSVAGGR
ncbi:sensor histidine kinase [Domibacillus sp. PGB-M46]|uniref:cache domain-containing sensor histidine kinase n=1 Tax=Domibacillus sp. PGB-M46 TaxID=2910255 RepID=UPI001F58EF9F|nr:sensor histidine kinase [Domibacillus sp. PGB-M46]MCI2253664.1 sensor histidine kinase [Domibacillus sp. PGB-M46]